MDAVCVGASTPERFRVGGVIAVLITAMGRHRRQMCRTSAAGFPDKKAKATSVPASSVKAGVSVGRLAVRATGSGNVQTARGTLAGIHVR